MRSIFLGLLPLCFALIISAIQPLISFSISSIWTADSGLSEKIRRACQLARRDGYRYIWIDSACIDKTSSSELSEAINSMYKWYRCAQVCYAFLVDVPSDENVRAAGSKFRTSRWFKRGWTLQELVAPRVVVFLSQDWEGLGTKDGLADVIGSITHIDREVLTHERAFSDESVAERMRWAAGRATARDEDEAYSLFGIFGITMPTVYGEGKYAFQRLQEEILQRIPDQSLLAWGSKYLPIPQDQEPFHISVDCTHSATPFAPSPDFFASSELSRGRTVRATGDYVKSLRLPIGEYTYTPYGIRTQLCLLPLKAFDAHINITGVGSATVQWHLVILQVASQDPDDAEHLLGKLCYLRRDELASMDYLHVPDWIDVPSPSGGFDRHNALIFTLSSNDFSRIPRAQLRGKTVYLPHPKPSVAERHLKGENSTLNLTLPTLARGALQRRGYTISHIVGPTEHHRNTSSFTLFHTSFNIHIHYRHMLVRSAVVIEARVWILSSADSEEALRSDATIQCFSPYTSATWAYEVPWTMTLPGRSIRLVAHSGDEVTLRLGLDLTASSRYNVRVEIAPAGTTVGVPFRPNFMDLPRVLNAPHEVFNLTLPGSVRRALNTKGYAVHLGPGPNIGGFHSHSLTISSSTYPDYSIVIKYFHTLHCDIPRSDSPQALVIVARVTLESSIPDDGSETYRDGPYAVIWRDIMPPTSGWRWSLEGKQVVLATPTGESLTLHLGFDLAWQSEYYLRIDIEPETSGLKLLDDGQVDNPYLTLNGVHGSVSLTLPGHVKRALQTAGYQVHSEGLNGENNPPCHRLSLFQADAAFTMVIEYFHFLTTDPPELEPDSGESAHPELDSGLPTSSTSDNLLADFKADRQSQQKLTFQACVTVASACGPQCAQVAAREGELETTVDWDARHPKLGGWRRHLPKKDIPLNLPTGAPLTLRLGFNLVWYSEYCLTVDILRKPGRYDLVPPMTYHDSFEFETSTEPMDVTTALRRWAEEMPDDEPFLPDPVTFSSAKIIPLWGREHAPEEVGDSEDGDSVTSLEERA